ncbi:MAG TPA: DUF460 domain-containing protein [archaeon]|nr:DUF460 domain-containing protein [archaeon]
MAKPIIVGFDPGVNSAYSVIDLQGNVLGVFSERNASLSSIKQSIIRIGRPLIIATDKANAPSSCKNMAAAFNCKLFTPERDVPVKDKIAVLKSYKLERQPKNTHEKDSLAAALVCYKSLASRFNKIELALQSLGLETETERIKEMLLKKEAKNISEAIEMIFSKETERQENKQEQKAETSTNPEADVLRAKLADLQKSYDILKMYTSKLEAKAKSLEEQKSVYQREQMQKNDEARKRVLKEKEVVNRDILIHRLQLELSKYKHYESATKEERQKEDELREITQKGLLPVVSIDRFETDTISELHQEFGLRDKIVWIKKYRPSKPILRYLITLGPKAIIGELDEDGKKLLKDNEIIHVVNVEIKQKYFFGMVKADEFERAALNIEKNDFINWLDNYKRNRV